MRRSKRIETLDQRPVNLDGYMAGNGICGNDKSV